MLTLAEPASYEEIIKKSRFLCNAAPVESVEEALSFLERVRDPGATHNCWAYRVGQHYRFSDDGEPAGTAGRPILSAIEGQGLDRVIVVVTRYFGGVKLGAGGLVRAYGGVAAKCLQRADKRPIVRMRTLRVHVPFEALGPVYDLLAQAGFKKTEAGYDAEGTTLLVEVPEEAKEAFVQALADATRGRAVVEAVA